MSGSKRARLSAVALGVAFGVMCGGWMLLIGLLAWNGQFTSFTTEKMTHWASIFPGVETTTMVGSFVAGAWGFLKGFFTGLLLGWIYNICVCGCSACCSCCKCNSCGGKAQCGTGAETK